MTEHKFLRKTFNGAT